MTADTNGSSGPKKYAGRIFWYSAANLCDGLFGCGLAVGVFDSGNRLACDLR